MKKISQNMGRKKDRFITANLQTANLLPGCYIKMRIEYPTVHKDANKDKAYQKQNNAEVSRFGDPTLEANNIRL